MRRRARRVLGRGPAVTPEAARHLAEWTRARHGVEAFVEPPTTVTELTVCLVAHDGEWTRRRIGDARSARRLGEELAIPVYDVGKVGYPQRMRDHDARERVLRRRERRERDT
ncbi:oxidoreductase [Rhodococcus aerolatus]